MQQANIAFGMGIFRISSYSDFNKFGVFPGFKKYITINVTDVIFK